MHVIIFVDNWLSKLIILWLEQFVVSSVNLLVSVCLKRF